MEKEAEEKTSFGIFVHSPEASRFYKDEPKGEGSFRSYRGPTGALNTQQGSIAQRNRTCVHSQPVHVTRPVSNHSCLFHRG